MKTISVALATYNGEAYIAEQLASIGSQRSLPSEIVVSDDASSDETLTIIEAFAAHSAIPVRIYRNNEQLGFRINFMRCIELCQGDLVALCDQDDVWEPEKLAMQLRDFDDPKVLLSCHNAILIDGQGRALGRTLDVMPNTPDFEFREHSPYTFTPGFTILFRRDLSVFSSLWQQSIESHDPMLRLSHDKWLLLLASSLGRVRYHKRSFARYRQHGGNVSGTIGRTSLRTNIVRRAANRTEQATRMSLVWHNRLSCLEEVKAKMNNGIWPASLDGSRRLDNAIEAYRTLADASTRRSTVYADGSMLRRAALMAGMLRVGDYHFRDPWRFTIPGLFRDLFLGA